MTESILNIICCRQGRSRGVNITGNQICQAPPKKYFNILYCKSSKAIQYGSNLLSLF